MIYTHDGKMLGCNEGHLRKFCCHVCVWELDIGGDLINTYEVYDTPSFQDAHRVDTRDNRIAILRTTEHPSYNDALDATDIFLTKLWDNRYSNYYTDVAVDGDGNIYCSAKFNHVHIIKFNSLGVHQWNFNCGDYYGAERHAFCLVIGFDGNIYVGCDVQYLVCINPSGVGQWDFVADYSGIYDEIDVDDEGYVYAIVADDPWVIKVGSTGKDYSFAGTGNWEASLHVSGPELRVLKVDRNGDIIIGTGSITDVSWWDRWDNDTYGTPAAWILDVDYSAGDKVFSYLHPSLHGAYNCKIPHTSTMDTKPGYGVAWEYVWEKMPKHNLWKINSAGVQQWHKFVDFPIAEMAVDLLNNVYTAGTRTDSKSVRKYDSDFTSEAWSYDTVSNTYDICFSSDFVNLTKWKTGKSYVVDDLVENNGNFYECTQNHTSGAANEPGVGVDWETYWTEIQNPTQKIFVAGNDVTL